MRIPTQLIVCDAVDRKRHYVQHSVMRATKTTQQITHFLSGPCLSNVNIVMHEYFRKILLECIVVTVKRFSAATAYSTRAVSITARWNSRRLEGSSDERHAV